MKTETDNRLKIVELLQQRELLIAGPCSAESEEQVLKTAVQLATIPQVKLMRAGVWKPRTNPGGFEGAGIKALPWLVKARSITGLPFGVEVATARHAEDALGFDADFLWIGARTTVNPFSVQQIADALRGTSVPVLIKNPVSADLKLWIGATERLLKSSTGFTGLIHRGFTSYGDTSYRNAPLWQIPIEMKRLFPSLPMISDPSHICGSREKIEAVSQRSIDLGYDGLMIEVHSDPHLALTDREQQLDPMMLKNMIARLEYKRTGSQEPEYLVKLRQLRDQIDSIDDELLSALARRMDVSQQIGDLKKENSVTVLQSSRWQEILLRAEENGVKRGLSRRFVKTYMQALHLESIRVQQQKEKI